jgi:hypothetical protein
MKSREHGSIREGEKQCRVVQYLSMQTKGLNTSPYLGLCPFVLLPDSIHPAQFGAARAGAALTFCLRGRG